MKDDKKDKDKKKSFIKALMSYGARDEAEKNTKKNKVKFLDKDKLRKFSFNK